jgi:hypothetical protein
LLKVLEHPYLDEDGADISETICRGGKRLRV